MYTLLKTKLQSWSLERLERAAQHLPIAPLGSRDVGYHEQNDDSLFIIKKYQAIGFSNNGNIASLINTRYVDSTDFDFEVIRHLNTERPDIIVKPVETFIEDKLKYTLYNSPNDQLGIPLVAEYFTDQTQFNDAYIITYIDQIEWLIKILDNLNCPYPERFVGLENRLHNDTGYYFYNISNFNSTKEKFIDTQLEYFQLILNTPIFVLLNKSMLLQRARELWV